MIESYVTIKNQVQVEIEVKKSAFIANLKNVSSELDAKDFIVEMSKKYNDARHNVPVYRILSDDHKVIESYSDNGEPKGTAGMPILDILRGKELVNVCIVVTRYFGGVLLGTGGLVRAYGDSAKEALNVSEFVTRRLYSVYQIEFNYSYLEKMKHIFSQNNIKFENIIYTDVITMDIFLQGDDAEENISKLLSEIMNNNYSIHLIKNNSYL